MQTLVERLYENKPLMLAAAVIAFLIAALLLLVIIRMLFGSRLRMPGGRARQARLGIVDAFDLDRQRQLIIVRRDNTEHLIMIGGPNDVLIESEIIRVEAREARRDKESQAPALPTGAAFNEPRIPAPFPIDRPEPTRGPDELSPVLSRPVEDTPTLPSPLPTPIPASSPARDDAFATLASPSQPAEQPTQEIAAPVPTPRAPTFPLPPRRPAPPAPNRPATRPLERAVRTEPAPPSLEAAVTPTAEAEQIVPTAPLAPASPALVRPVPPPFLRPLPPRTPRVPQRPVGAGSAAAPDAAVAPPAVVPSAAPPPPVSPPAPEPEQIGPKDTLESLEEEMAKLLGRGAGER